MNSKNKIIDLLFRNNTFGGSFAISVLLNAALLAVALKVGVLPKIVMSKPDSMAVTVSDVFNVTPPPARPAEAPVMPSFGMKDVPVPSASSLSAVPAEIVSSPGSPLNFSAPSPQVIPPRPISVAEPSTAMPVSGTSGNSRVLGSGTILPGGGYTSKHMIGGLEVPEEKLMVVMPSSSGNHPGPISMLPDSYHRSLVNRAGPYLLGVKGRSLGYALNDDFVNEWIDFAERTKPEAIYWLHWTIGSEYAPARRKLVDWIKASGMKVYVSSWDVPLSKELQEVVRISGGEYEHRNTANRPSCAMKTTPEGSELIRKTLSKWGEILQEGLGHSDVWEGIVCSFMHKPFGVTVSSKKTEDSIAVSFSVKDTSMTITVPKEMVSPESWDEMIGLWDQRKTSAAARANPMILFARGGDNGHYLVKKDPKTGYWLRNPAPSVDDLVPRSSQR